MDAFVSIYLSLLTVASVQCSCVSMYTTTSQQAMYLQRKSMYSHHTLTQTTLHNIPSLHERFNIARSTTTYQLHQKYKIERLQGKGQSVHSFFSAFVCTGMHVCMTEDVFGLATIYLFFFSILCSVSVLFIFFFWRNERWSVLATPCPWREMENHRSTSGLDIDIKWCAQSGVMRSKSTLVVFWMLCFSCLPPTPHSRCTVLRLITTR